MFAAQATTTGYKILVVDSDYKTLEEKNYDENWNLTNQKEYTYDESGILLSTTETNLITDGIYSIIKKDKDGTILSSKLNYDNYQNKNITSQDTNLTKLNGTSLDELLTQAELQEIQDKIEKAIQNCTSNSEKAVIPAVILISELASCGYYLPYYYSGGHGNLTQGIDGTLGSTTAATGETTKRNVKSYDCSGLVNWTINTALGLETGNWSFTGGTTSFYMNNGTAISRENVSTGDVFANSGHMFLVLDTYTDTDGSLRVICAESHADGWLSDNGAQCSDGVEIVDYKVSSIPTSYQLYNLDNLYDSLFDTN